MLLAKPEFRDGIRTRAINNNYLEHSEHITIKFIHLPMVCYINEQNQISVMSVTRLSDYKSLIRNKRPLFKWRLFYDDGTVLETIEFVDENGFFGNGEKCLDWHEAIKRVKVKKAE